MKSEQARQADLLPTSPMGDAVGYALYLNEI